MKGALMSFQFKQSLLASSISIALTACGGGATEETPKDNDPSSNNPTQSQDTKAYSSVFSTRSSSSAVTQQCGTAGGHEINSGFDQNDNKVLDTNEIDKTFIVCNGQQGLQGTSGQNGQDGAPGQNGQSGQDTSISTTALDGSGTECAGVGGTKLMVNGTPHLMCNADPAIAPAKDFVKARAMVNGMSAWIANLENLDDQVASLEEQAKKVADLYGQGVNDDGVDKTVEAITVLAGAMALMIDDTDGTQALQDVINGQDIADMVVSTTGSLTKTGNVISISDDLSVTMLAENGETGVVGSVSVAIDMGDVTLPATSGTSFNVSLDNVVADSDKAAVSAATISVSVTTGNNITFSAPDVELPEQDSGGFSASLQIGTDTSPANLTTKVTNNDVSAISFDGQLAVNVIAEKKGFGEFKQLELTSGDVMFIGKLAYDGKSVEVDLGLDVTKRSMFNYDDFNDMLGDLETGNVLTDLMTITLDNEYDNGSGVSRNYDVEIGGETYSFSLDDYGTSVDYYVDGGYGTASTVEGAIRSSIEIITGDGYYDASSNKVWSEVTLYKNEYFGDRTGSVDIDGAFDLSKGLPTSVDQSLSYDMVDIEDVNYNTEGLRPSFESHSRYTLTAGLKLAGIPDGQGGVLPAVKLEMEAERWGGLGRSGELSFTLAYGGEQFIARYEHRDMFYTPSSNYNETQNSELYRGNPLKFSFMDNKGGVIVMDDFAPIHSSSTQTLVDCYLYDDYPDTVESACALGTRKFQIKYNGLDHGYIYGNYYTGDWIATYYDGVEESVYEYKD